MDKDSTILIIDDEPALLLGLAAKIKRQGYHVVTACDGREGMQKAWEVLPDLILSDVMMPPPNGFELRKLMGQDPKLASIPFIFLTARTGVEDRVNGIRDGADDYITKPFVTEELFARIEAVLRRVKMERDSGRAEAREQARQDMEKLKREILQNFHHEMRTPLSNIIMALELAVSNKFEDPQEQVQFVHAALSNVDRLESLVTDFVLLTNIDHGDLNHIRQHIDIDNHILLPIQKRFARYSAKELEFT
ncbi:MAG: response regulator, partial [Chloroflexota bacterium]